MLAWIDNRWHLEGKPIHAGAGVEIRWPDRTWESGRIESSHVGRKLWFHFDHRGENLVVLVCDLDRDLIQQTIRWPQVLASKPFASCDAEKEIVRLRMGLGNLREYVAVEGYCDDVGHSVVGLAYQGSNWGPYSHPETQPYELAESVEKWLHTKIDAILEAKHV
jgi:hypothetical protein